MIKHPIVPLINLDYKTYMAIKKIVTITGGNGGFSLLRGLSKFPWEINAIVAMTDDGGSTGRLRKELGVLPPGDVRYCLSALTSLPGEWEEILNYRFEKGGLKGHTIGNLMLAALEKFHGNFLKAVEEMEKILAAKGRVIPATLDNAELCARLENSKIIRGQHNIDTYPCLQKKGIQNIYISPKAKANPIAIKSIMSADVVSIGPGNLYCSIIPNLAIKELGEAILKTRALVVYHCNLLNRKNHTENFTVDDYVRVINDYLGRERVDAVTVQKKPDKNRMNELCISPDDLVKYDLKRKVGKNYWVFETDLIDKECVNHSESDAIAYLRSPVRHDGEKVGRAIIKIYKKLRK